MTDITLDTIVAEFVANFDNAGTDEQRVELENVADKKLLELANNDQEVFLNLRKEAAVKIANALLGGAIKLEEKPAEDTVETVGAEATADVNAAE